MSRSLRHSPAVLATVLVVAACGGGGDSSSDNGGGSGGTSDQQRIQAATITAERNSQCTAIRPFYWEVGDRNSAMASGSVNSSTDPKVYTASSVLSIASASKWIYGTYVVQKRAAALSSDDFKYLNFESGYTNFTECLTTQTVAQCDAYQTNGVYTPANDGRFFYDGGHMERHAVLMGLGDMNNAALGAEVRSALGSDVTLAYSQPQLAGGVYLTPSAYALMLRKILAGQLLMGSMLGAHPVCTNPKNCASSAFAPIPSNESWHYSIGHWVEDDPVVGDGAFSSPGAFGFYPWIDASKTYYGVVARSDSAGALDSVDCGRLVRKAWVTGVAQ